MPQNRESELARALREEVLSLQEHATADVLMDVIGDADYVLLGEASHGTHDFYRLRAELTKRLICTKEFNAVAVEGDWPDTYRVNRYVRALSDAPSALAALSGFERFPAWMWRNADVLDFVGWLRAHNDQREERAKVGFYGIDLYSLHSSIEAVLRYLEQHHPEEARAARVRYGCFDVYGQDPQTYGYATAIGRSPSCEEEVVSQLLALQERRRFLLEQDGYASADALLCLAQNALVIKNAERYYRTMFRGGRASWNLRDTHMADTLDALAQHYQGQCGGAKLVVWAHNSHLGDARATEAGDEGELNVGQLMRERHGAKAVAIGFSTYTGTVTAASNWGASAERKQVRPGLRGSYEALFHDVSVPNFALVPKRSRLMSELAEPRLQRAIGVLYLPKTERQSHYYHVRLTDQFDAIIHLDQTRAVEPLDRAATWTTEELPETYPSGV